MMMLVILLLMGNVAYADELRIGAGAAPTENVLKPLKEPFEKATGIKLTIISSGPKIALQDLEKGAVDAASAGLTYDDWMSLMKKEGAEVKDAGSLQRFIIGKDSIVVLVHKDNPVTKLSKDQLKGVFNGKIQNWKEVGGRDMPIIVVWGKLIPGTNSLFQKHIMDGEAVVKDVLDATTAEDVKQNIGANPEAVGIGPKAVVDGSVRSPETPEVSRPITLLTKGDPSANVRKLLDFIKGEGQKFVK
ncbi:MAG TPA: substrate-binding domain-containing protein [Dissulfurispiraceae bacterium]|nr:substrate-binding domain-containing protein [Dissulfurispiraceae bacterium]